MQNIQKMSDRELIDLCQTYGDNSIFWSRKFGALLPEVLKRGLYKKKFYSIYEFAARLAGMNRETVDEILRVNEKLSDKPLLQAQIEKQGWSKMRVVANVATKETEKFWVEKVQILPKRALEMYISEMKNEEKSATSGRQNIASTGDATLFDDRKYFLPGEEIGENFQKVKFVSLLFKVDPDTEFRLRKFQQKLEKERKQTVTFNEVLKNLLDQAEKNVDNKQSKSGEIFEAKTETETQINQPVSRHVLAKKRRAARGSGKCSHPGCNKPATEIHHIDRFSITKNHENIISLCHEHHILEHAEGISDEAGEMGETNKTSEAKKRVDQKYFEHLNGG